VPLTNPSGRVVRVAGCSRSATRGSSARSAARSPGAIDLDAEVPADHEVRAIAAVVDRVDLRGRYAD
jgi:hypothetical protein